MVDVVDEIDDSLNDSGQLALIRGSDENVSDFHPIASNEVSYLKRGSPVIGRSPSQSRSLSSLYDKAAVEKAFGPMKDVGRWYTSYNSAQYDQEDRYIHRPMAPIPLQSLEEEEQRLTSRPLPPIPNEPVPDRIHPPPPPPRRHEDDAVYEHIQHKMLGSNSLTLDLRNLAKYGWYWGPITRVEAEERLSRAKDGTFLVRDSSDERYLLSLSFHSQGKTLHTRIEYCNGNFSFYSFPDADTEGYPSVVELIQRSMQYSRDGVFCFSRARAIGSPAVPVRLLKPFSRFSHVQTLQHYCRFVIRQSIRFDKIRQLPLPRHVHGFLEQSQF
jgi:suppressor of cytokine signaling 7